MIGPLPIEEDRRQRQADAASRWNEPPPARYRAIAEWWRIHAETSAAPGISLGYASSQERLADDMEARPGHYRLKMPGETDWQRSGLASSATL